MAGAAFAVKIVRDLNPNELGWYSSDVNPQGDLGMNRRYEDMRAFGWGDVQDTLAVERDVIAKVEATAFNEEEDETPEEAAAEILESHEGAQNAWSPWGGPFYGLDLGVAAAVIAISAARCVPFSSCNAGAFGGSHSESYPCVAFYMRPQLAAILTACAERASVGLTLGLDKSALLYANGVDGMMAFAQACFDAQTEINAIEVELEADLIAGDDDESENA